MQTEKTIKLRKPIDLGGVIYEKLDLREPTAGELEKASVATTQIGVVINLVMLVAKVPRPVVEQIGQRDLKEVGAFLESFSEDEEPTGETLSPT